MALSTPDLLAATYRGKTVFMTGHTGFKGAWLSEWLLMLDAQVVGYSLDPPSRPSLYEQLDLKHRVATDHHADIRDLERLESAIRAHQPDFVFHLAAQTLVGPSYQDPIYNHQTNIMGTINVLEAVRRAKRDCVVVVITTDKVYENNEWDYAYRENDAFGGYDPYSTSKACCEIVTASYRRSFFTSRGEQTTKVHVATVRAGNVIGGGDWATDRIVPDCMRGLAAGEAIPVRNKVATRPWQHVLEPLSGYLALGARIAQAAGQSGPEGERRLSELCSGFNFGPNMTSNRTVAELVQEVLRHWPGRWVDRSNPDAPHEAGKLNLASDKAFHSLGWHPQWNFEQTVQRTVEWYLAAHQAADNLNVEFATRLTREQITDYARGCVYLQLKGSSL